MAEEIRIFFELDKVVYQLPVNPETLDISFKGSSKSAEIIKLGEVNMLQKQKPKEIKFESFLPENSSPPYVLTKGKFFGPQAYIDFFDKALNLLRPVRFIVYGTKINMLVFIDSFSPKYEAGTLDVSYEISLKEYREFVAKKVTIVQKTTTASGSSSTQKANANTATTGFKGNLYSTTSLNVRTGPGIGYKVVGVLKVNDKVVATGKTSGSWVEVVYKGEKRWCSKKYLSKTKQVVKTSVKGAVQAKKTTKTVVQKTPAKTRGRTVGKFAVGDHVWLNGRFIKNGVNNVSIRKDTLCIITGRDDSVPSTPAECAYDIRTLPPESTSTTSQLLGTKQNTFFPESGVAHGSDLKLSFVQPARKVP